MAYTRLIRLYYRREKPIPLDINEACRLIRAASKQERAAVASVLTEFFVKGEDGWHQARCDSEIEIYQAKVEHNRRVGKKGGRPRKTETQTKPAENPPGYFREPEKNPPQTPDTSYSESKDSGGKPPKLTDPNEIIFGYGLPMLTAAGNSDKHARSFLGGLRKEHGDEAVIDKLRECAKTRPLQPLEWLAAALPPKTKPGKHTGFDQKNYREGVTADGSLV